MDTISCGAVDIKAERERQVRSTALRPADVMGRQTRGEGWSADHDDQWVHGEMARAAAVYAAPGPAYERCSVTGNVEEMWPWSDRWDKRRRNDAGFVPPLTSQQAIADRRRELVKAGALIAAEIDRIDRLARVYTPAVYRPGALFEVSGEGIDTYAWIEMSADESRLAVYAFECSELGTDPPPAHTFDVRLVTADPDQPIVFHDEDDGPGETTLRKHFAEGNGLGYFGSTEA